MAAELCLAMETLKHKKALRVPAVSFLALAAAGVMFHSRRVAAAGQAGVAPQVREISVHEEASGAVAIEVSVSGNVSYRTLHLSHPDRLVLDLEGAHESGLQGEYPAQSALLKQVRASQWKSDPAVVRVVADLKGDPSFNITRQASGIRIELKPRGANLATNQTSGAARAHHAAGTPGRESRTALDDPPPGKAFQVHRFKDLSASLTAPVLPSHDKLIPVADPEVKKPHREQISTPAQVSGISIHPGAQGGITVDIASSRSVPYRVFQLADPFRLVVDLKDARDTSDQKIYPANSPVLKRVRVSQWRPDNPSVVRVVADLEGYPIFDVFAQKPGIHIELRPRYAPGALMRNPFQFKTTRQKPQAVDHTAISKEELTAGGNSPAPADAFSGFKVIGFIDKAGEGTQAVISHNSSVYLVAKGEKFENNFTVVAISPNAAEVQNTLTGKTAWITYTPR